MFLLQQKRVYFFLCVLIRELGDEMKEPDGYSDLVFLIRETVFGGAVDLCVSDDAREK